MWKLIKFNGDIPNTLIRLQIQREKQDAQGYFHE